MKTIYFGKNLRLLRNRNHLSQPKLGEMINKSESTIQMYESGKRMPTARTATDLSIIFGIPLDDLINKDLSVENENEVKININESFGKRADDLLLIYSSLNNEGKDKLIDYAIDLKKIYPKNR